jgi:hypothetical protein
VKGCTVREPQAFIAPFFVYRGAALALDATSLEDSETGLSSYCAQDLDPENFRPCEFEDGTPSTGEIPLLLEVAEYCLTGSITPSEIKGMHACAPSEKGHSAPPPILSIPTLLLYSLTCPVL